MRLTPSPVDVTHPRCARRSQHPFPNPTLHFFCGSGHTYTSMRVTAIVRKKTASWGCVGQIARVKPSFHAPVPIALASKEAFRVFIHLASSRTLTFRRCLCSQENRVLVA